MIIDGISNCENLRNLAVNLGLLVISMDNADADPRFDGILLKVRGLTDKLNTTIRKVNYTDLSSLDGASITEAAAINLAAAELLAVAAGRLESREDLELFGRANACQRDAQWLLGCEVVRSAASRH
jgi:hypothetical protein